AAILALYWTGDTLNVMTLGGMALAVGRLVDDSIVVLENTHRHLGMGKLPEVAALEAAEEVRMPILAATIVTVIVFAPVLFLSGIGRFLFTPLAASVAFAMLASYVVALTFVPVYCARFLRAETGTSNRWAGAFERLFDRGKAAYGSALERVLSYRLASAAVIVLVVLASFLLYPAIGTEFFPQVNAGQFNIQMHAPLGTRIEKAEQHVTEVERAIRDVIPQSDPQMLIPN